MYNQFQSAFSLDITALSTYEFQSIKYWPTSNTIMVRGYDTATSQILVYYHTVFETINLPSPTYSFTLNEQGSSVFTNQLYAL